MQQLPDDQLIREKVLSLEEVPVPGFDANAAWAAIETPGRKRRAIIWWQVAAAVVLLLGSVTLWWQLTGSTSGLVAVESGQPVLGTPSVKESATQAAANTTTDEDSSPVIASQANTTESITINSSPNSNSQKITPMPTLDASISVRRNLALCTREVTAPEPETSAPKWVWAEAPTSNAIPPPALSGKGLVVKRQSSPGTGSRNGRKLSWQWIGFPTRSPEEQAEATEQQDWTFTLNL